MNTDRPAGGPGDDAPPPTRPVPAEPTQVIPEIEPTEVIPGAFPPFVPSGQVYPQPAYPQQGYPSQGYPQPNPYLPQQPGQYPAAQGFIGQPGGYGWQPPAGPPGHWAAAPPQPLAGFPPPARAPQRGRGWVVALVTVAAVLAVSLIAALAVPVLAQLPARHGGLAPSPSAPAGGKPTPSPSTSPSPGSSPTPAMPTDPLDVLKKNPIYALKVPARCPDQSIPGSLAAFRKQVGKLVDCENAAWKKVLAPTAVDFSKPTVTFYSSTAKSPCGKLGTTFPASYCTGDSTIYFSLQSYVQGRYFRLSVAELVMHEYAHHVQHLAGIFDATDAMDESFAVTTRRIELQAHCMAHYALRMSGVGYDSSDRRELEYQWGYTSDATGHGSAKAEAYWGRRGLGAKTIGACNTWTVKASRVK